MTLCNRKPEGNSQKSAWRGVAGQLAVCVFVTIFLTGFLTGCRGSLSSQYGLSEGVDARCSPASISLFRNLCNADGRSTLTVRSFSPRAMKKLEAIVWTPDTCEPHNPKTYAWIDSWLASGDRTLIYVGRDYSPTADYWSQTAEKLTNNSALSQSALSAREQQAMELAALDRMRNRVRTKVATPWCLIDYSISTEEQVSELKGTWAEQLGTSKAKYAVRSQPVPYELETLPSLQSEFDWQPADTSAKPVNVNSYEAKWSDSDADMLKTLKGMSSTDLPHFESLLLSQNDKPLVSEITTSRWGRSRIIFLSNASLLSNLSLIHPGNLAISKQLMSMLPKQNIGFLTGPYDPPIRKDEFSSQQKGFEMLTMWPLNVITLHAVFLGMLSLLAAFPIFGRAKQLPTKTTREFSQHIEAVGSLLSKSQDRNYALRTISEYFRAVRKEPTSPWANVDPMHKQEAASPFKRSEEN